MTDSSIPACPCCLAPALLVAECEFFSLGCSRPDCRASGLYTTEPAAQLGQALAAWRRRAQPEATDDEIVRAERELAEVL